MGKLALATLAIVIVAVVGVVFYWLHRVPQPPDCSFSGWKRTVGVELEAQVKDLDAVKGKIGITDSQVRDYDTLMKNYALKYDAACQDMRAGRMHQSEYTCLRQNMDRVLDQVQRFVQAVDAAKSLSDATAQRQIILQSLNDLRAASATGYRSGCASEMDVNPKKISFTGNIPERSVQISNAGNNDFTYSITGLPEAFDPKPITGSVPKGTSVSVSILRTILPAPTPPIRFHVHTNLEDDAEVEISMDARNAVLWQNLAGQARQTAEKRGSPITVEDAVEVINNAVGRPSGSPESVHFLLASNVLLQLHADSQAQRALNMAVSRDPQLANQSATLLLSGLIANRQNRSDQALKLFAQAGSTASATDANAKGISDLFTGSIMIAKGKENQAKLVFEAPELQKALGKNPSLAAFSAQEFCATSTCSLSLSNGLHSNMMQ